MKLLGFSVEREHYIPCVIGLLLIFIVPSVGFAQSCTEQKINEKKAQCQSILNDVKKTLFLAKKERGKAVAKLLEAAEPAHECIKGGYDTVKDMLLYCNPKTPTLNPVLCAKAAIEIPSIYGECSNAVKLLDNSYSIYQNAKFITGTAQVAFSDQGGDEVMDFLYSCDQVSCQKVKGTVDSYISIQQRDIEQKMLELQATKEKLETTKRILKQCESNPAECKGNVPSIKLPEDKSKSIPDLMLP